MALQALTGGGCTTCYTTITCGSRAATTACPAKSSASPAPGFHGNGDCDSSETGGLALPHPWVSGMKEKKRRRKDLRSGGSGRLAQQIKQQELNLKHFLGVLFPQFCHILNLCGFIKSMKTAQSKLVEKRTKT